MTQIAIMGTGKMATSLGAGWSAAGHTVVFGSRSPSTAAAEIEREVGGGVRVASHRDALRGAEIVVLALPYRSVEAFAREYSSDLRSKVVVDISNPFDALPDNRVAGAEVTARAIGAGARVIAAFKDNFSTTLREPKDGQGRQRDVHFAGDDETAKRTFAKLVEDLGFKPVDCGALRNARALDAMVPLMIELDRRYNGQGRSSWKFLV
ncbi:MAG: NAD(P)-binding domain-containing protein [Chloroflexi bacterium]|nr:NAD(P)-binding domain-containing protein [Chloroflexota bacterium]